jgi:hypothetical protein
LSQPLPDPSGEFLLYQTEDGRTQVECRFEDDTIWLTQAQMAELFQVSVPNVNLHLKALYEEGEHSADATIKSYLIVRTEGAREERREVQHYRLEADRRASGVYTRFSAPRRSARQTEDERDAVNALEQEAKNRPIRVRGQE